VPRSLRVIAGTAGGRRLVSPPGDRLRPTADRVKESVFSALGPDRLTGARVLDLYAGTGALAIEALSRGAEEAMLVERDAAATRAIQANLESTGMAGRAVLRRGDVRRVLAGPAAAPFDLVFLDPPYDLPDAALGEVLERLAESWTAPEATLVVERSAAGGAPPWPPNWRSTWERCYGDTLMLFAQRE
jgi:16S rRNA (guanine966-N2)-methyltransferase